MKLSTRRARLPGMIVRIMTAADLDFAADCVTAEGWTSETRQAFENVLLHNGSAGFVAEQDGRAVGVVTATAYGAHGFIGELVVRREVRGRGFGPALLDAAVAHLRSRGVENVHLDAVERAAPYYETKGFRPMGRSLRFLGGVDAGDRPGVRRMMAGDVDAAARLDLEAFGADRRFFLERRFALAPEFARVLEDEQGISGFILALRGTGIVTIGPWIVAAHARRPLDLLESLAADAGDTPVRVGVLESNAAAVTTLRSCPGLVEKPFSLRMVLGPSDRLGNSPLCWGIGSPAKG